MVIVNLIPILMKYYRRYYISSYDNNKILDYNKPTVIIYHKYILHLCLQIGLYK